MSRKLDRRAHILLEGTSKAEAFTSPYGGGGEFRVASYEEATAGTLGFTADVAVCNFSLLGKESVETIFAAITALLNTGGAFIIQTLHPVVACGEAPYRDGWREGSWAGFSCDFTQPAPWYFRTLESWIAMLRRCRFDLVECREPTAANARTPASVIFVCTRSDP